MKNFRLMREQSPEELPREKCIREGASSLTDAELLAVLLRTGTKEKSVLELSEELLSREENFDGLVALTHLDPAELRKLRGIGVSKAAELSAVGEIARRIWNRKMRVRRLSFHRGGDVYDYFKEDLRYLDHEVIHILYLDNQLQLIRDVQLSRGTCSSSAISPRDIFREALRNGGVSIIMVHNHPSGVPEPSEEDRSFTAELFRLGQCLGIPLIDHIIMGDNAYYSFKEQGGI